MRRKNKKDMTIMEQLDEACNRACREICKYYDERKDIKDSLDEWEFQERHCKNCPLTEI